MHVSFEAQNVSKGQTSSSIFSYLNKENDKGISNEMFFGKEFEFAKSDEYTKEEAIELLDKQIHNSGVKDDMSKYYMLNISPSQKELEHIRTKSIEILKETEPQLFKVNSKSKEVDLYIEDKLDQIENLLLKDYTTKVMEQYAENFNRMVYVDPNNIPSAKIQTNLNKEIQDKFLKEIKDKYNIDFFQNKESSKYFDKFKIEQGNLKNGVNISVNVNDKDYKIFVPNKKFEVTNSILSINENYLNDAIEYKDYLKENSDKKISDLNKTIKADILKDDKIKSLFKIKIDDKELVFYANKKDFKYQNSNLIMNEFKLNKLIKDAQERNKEIELKFSNKVANNKKNTSFSFTLKPNNYDKEISIRLSNKDFSIVKGKAFIKKDLYDKKIDFAVKTDLNIRFGNIKNSIKNDVWKANGFNSEMRKLTSKDLLYFGKVESRRTYKGSNNLDKYKIDHNKEILKSIKDEKEKPFPSLDKIEALKKKLMKDKYTNELIKEGAVKGGNNKHIHVVVSRSDTHYIKAQDKLSLSPLTEQMNVKVHENSYGFNRVNFFENNQALFDKNFDYKRDLEQTYQFNNAVKNNLVNGSSELKNITKEQLSKILKVNELKRDLNPYTTIHLMNPVTQLKKELNILPLPSRIPTNALSAVKSLIRYSVKILGQGQSF